MMSLSLCLSAVPHAIAFSINTPFPDCVLLFAPIREIFPSPRLAPSALVSGKHIFASGRGTISHGPGPCRLTRGLLPGVLGLEKAVTGCDLNESQK